jgi:ubiquinone/menaquinone biosynthesis C-methylase UbiE
MPVPEDKIQRAYRVRIIIFLVCVVLAVAALSTMYQAIQTLTRLEVVESERDQWQRPSDIVRALNIREGNVVADIGSGAGYFALKLSQLVGKSGEVLAVDIQRVPLIFLRARTLLRNQYNVDTIRGEPDDPKLSSQQPVDAVLIVNAYHEFDHPQRILECVIRALRPGGRLVIVDRGPQSGTGDVREVEARLHELPPNLVENELRQSGFQLIQREDRFIDRPDERPWWLIVVRRP